MTEQLFHLKNNIDYNFIYKFKPEAFCVLVEAFQTNRSMSHFVKKMLLFSEDILLICIVLIFCLLLKPNFLFPSPTNVPIPCLPHGVPLCVKLNQQLRKGEKNSQFINT